MAPLAVLGLDAAWTPRHASGVALVAREAGGWRCLSVAASYRDFLDTGTMEPDPRALLAKAERLLRRPFRGVVTVDMPRAFGARGCAVHSCTPERPGAVSLAMREGFDSLGFPLATTARSENRLVEVYPHLAVMALLDAQYRVPYKLARARRYWPQRIAGIPLEIPARASKPFEDALDALVCAWIGVEFLEGRAAAYGDDTAAIWVPTRACGAAA